MAGASGVEVEVVQGKGRTAAEFRNERKRAPMTRVEREIQVLIEDTTLTRKVDEAFARGERTWRKKIELGDLQHEIIGSAPRVTEGDVKSLTVYDILERKLKKGKYLMRCNVSRAKMPPEKIGQDTVTLYIWKKRRVHTM